MKDASSAQAVLHVQAVLLDLFSKSPSVLVGVGPGQAFGSPVCRDNQVLCGAGLGLCQERQAAVSKLLGKKFVFSGDKLS